MIRTRYGSTEQWSHDCLVALWSSFGLVVACGCGSSPPGVVEREIAIVAQDTLTLATLDSIGFTTMSHPYQMGSGRILVAPLTEPGRIAVFGENGALVNLVGVSGPGPGELGRIDQLVPSGNSMMMVFHRGMASQGTLVGDSLVVGPALPAPTLNEAVPIGDSMVLASRLVMAGAHVAPLGLYDHRLHLVHEYENPFRSLDGDIIILHAADDENGGMIVAPLTGFEFSKIDIGSGIVTPIKPATTRFPTTKLKDLDRRQPDVAKPYPRVLSIRVAAPSRLAVIYAMARDDWKAATVQPQQGEGSLVAISDYPKYMTFFLDVLDIDTGELLAHARLPGAVVGFTTDSTLVGYVERPDGDVAIVLYRILLNQNDDT